jgi:tetratricopeptide (TPR) repeat protein
MILAVFGQTFTHDFVNFDDPAYVSKNPIILAGLSWEGVIWAFTHIHSCNWHPLTTLSHLLDCSLYGTWAGGHHLNNVLLHAATSVLLFLWLKDLTGFFWRSAFVAMVFAIHPLRVESVAWVAERKDVLSGLFFMLTLRAFLRYVRSPSQRIPYNWALAFFALGLMAKPMLVTLPFLLLLIDYWPLHRYRTTFSFLDLVREKIPFFVLSAFSCIATVVAQRGAISVMAHITLDQRLANAVVSYGLYGLKLFYPFPLLIPHPMPENGQAIWKIITCGLVLSTVTFVFLKFRHKTPYLVVGWFWYLGMLLPVIGILQVGQQAYADRYTYLPQIGLVLALTWTTVELSKSWKYQSYFAVGGALTLLVILFVAAHRQTAFWKNSTTLWTHTLKYSRNNSVAHNNFGAALADMGKIHEAEFHYHEALRINPNDSDTHYNLGIILLKENKNEEAISQLREALRIQPEYAEAENNLGYAMAESGKENEALEHYRRALQIEPQDAQVYFNLGNALYALGRTDDAITSYRNAVRINPAYTEADNNLGNALLRMGKVDEAISAYRESLRINDQFADAHSNLSVALYRAGFFDEGNLHRQEAARIRSLK